MQETKNYDQFKMVKGNREINSSHVRRLAESIEKNGYLGTPIQVSKTMEILDGQHRFMALQYLNKSIPFEIKENLNIKDIQALNAVSRTWTTLDYIKSFASLNNESYIWLIGLLENHGDIFKPTSLAYLTARSMPYHDLKSTKPTTSALVRPIKEGRYIAYNKSIVDKLIGVKSDLEVITNKPGDVGFITAIGWVIRYVDVDFEKFLISCKQNKHLLEYGFPSSGLYLKEFQTIWNKGKMTKNHVNFFEKTCDTCLKENLKIDNSGN